MADIRYCGDGHGIYAGTYIDLDQFIRPSEPTLHVMDRPTFIERRKRMLMESDVDRPRANVIDDERGRYEWSYPTPRLFFIEYRGVQYAIIEHSADEAISIVEFSERYQAWR